MTATRNAPHLLRVDEPPERYAPLFAAARAEGLRLGWLDLAASSPAPLPVPLPAPLETAAGLGALRAVAVAGDRSVAVKPLKGAPVLRDLLREHFRGCVLVLVRGEGLSPLSSLSSDIAVLQEAGEGWSVTAPGEAARAFTTADLAAALRRPRPWGPPLPPRVVRPPVEKKEKKRRGQRVKKAKDKKDTKDPKDRKDKKDRP
jgi:hypothetical protein